MLWWLVAIDAFEKTIARACFCVHSTDVRCIWYAYSERERERRDKQTRVHVSLSRCMRPTCTERIVHTSSFSDLVILLLISFFLFFYILPYAHLRECVFKENRNFHSVIRRSSADICISANEHDIDNSVLPIIWRTAVHFIFSVISLLFVVHL